MISFRARVVRCLLRKYNAGRVYTQATLESTRKESGWLRKLFFVQKRHFEYVSIADIPVVKITPYPSEKRTIIYLHGGGFVFGLSPAHLLYMKHLSRLCEANVIAIDYCLAPEHPYPKALEEIERVWQRLIADGAIEPQNTALVGDSAGGNLALASAMRWREAKIDQPACLVLLSPGLDATLRGESYSQKASVDPILSRAKLEFFSSAYAGATSKENPFISPIYADLHNLPPMLIHVGSDEMLLSDSQTAAHNIQKSGGDATLYASTGMWHCWHLFAPFVPEARRDMRAVAAYIREHLAAEERF